jgi:hypothetical protein
MKPVLTRPQHEFYTDNKLYFEVDIDVHIFPLLTKKSLPAVAEMSGSLTVDVGFTVEGRHVVQLRRLMFSKFDQFHASVLVRPRDTVAYIGSRFCSHDVPWWQRMAGVDDKLDWNMLFDMCCIAFNTIPNITPFGIRLARKSGSTTSFQRRCSVLHGFTSLIG